MVEKEKSQQPGELEGGADTSPRRPVLVINIYSWAIPIVALVTLAIGALAGYYGRSLLPRTPEISGDQSVDSAQQPVATIDNSPENRQRVMEYLVSKARHFRGNENAPVTMVDFSDFQ